MEASMRMEIQGNWLWKRQTYVGSYKIPSKLWLFRFFFFFFWLCVNCLVSSGTKANIPPDFFEKKNVI